MSDDVFRVIITIGFAASWVTTIVMAVAMLGIYRSSKRLEEKLELLSERVRPVLDSARSLVDDARPKIQEIIVQAAEITASARDQMARLDALVNETSDCVRIQIERIDMLRHHFGA